MNQGEFYARVSEDRESIEAVFFVCSRGQDAASLGLADLSTGGWVEIPEDPDDLRRYVIVDGPFAGPLGPLVLSESQRKAVLLKAKPNLRDYLKKGLTPKTTFGGYKIVKIFDSGLDVSETNWPITAWIEIKGDGRTGPPVSQMGYDLQGNALFTNNNLDIVLKDIK